VSSAARLLFVLCLALTALLATRAARADDPGDGLPIVASGREAEIQALVAPYALQKNELQPGWHLENIAIDATAIRFVAQGPGAATATLRLDHPDRAPSAERTASFALHRETSAGGGGDAPAPSVLDPLVVAIRKNDTGHFWPPPRPIAPGQGKGAEVGSRRADTRPPRWELTLRRKLLLGGLVASLLFLLVDRLRSRARAA
jgi:hypothetical protein